MRVKWTALTFGCVMALFFLTSGLADLDDDGLRFSEWVGTILLSLAAGVLMSWLYYHINRYLQKKGLSLHDDEDFEDE
jgi:hypothetical protein